MVLLAAAAGGIWALLLSQRPPEWWRPVSAKNAQADTIARQLENGIATILTRIRGKPLSRPGTMVGPIQSGPIQPGPAQAEPTTKPPANAPPTPNPSEDGEFWTVALKASDANAWFATRLRLWLENEGDTSFRWPASLGDVQVRFDQGVIHIGASIRPLPHESSQTVSTSTPTQRDPESQLSDQSDAAPPQVLIASLVPEFKDDGSFWLPARQVSIGSLSLPARWMLRSGSVVSGSSTSKNDLRSLPQARNMFAAFAGDIAIMPKPIIKIGDGRRIRLAKVDPRDGVLYITFQTLPRDTPRAQR